MHRQTDRQTETLKTDIQTGTQKTDIQAEKKDRHTDTDTDRLTESRMEKQTKTCRQPDKGGRPTDRRGKDTDRLTMTKTKTQTDTEWMRDRLRDKMKTERLEIYRNIDRQTENQDMWKRGRQSRMADRRTIKKLDKYVRLKIV